MKKALLIILILFTIVNTSVAQSITVSQSVFVDKYTQMYDHLNNNQLALAEQDFDQLKNMIGGNFDSTRAEINNAATLAVKDTLRTNLRSKKVICSEITHLAVDKIANKVMLKQKFDEYANIY